MVPIPVSAPEDHNQTAQAQQDYQPDQPVNRRIAQEDVGHQGGTALHPPGQPAAGVSRWRHPTRNAHQQIINEGRAAKGYDDLTCPSIHAAKPHFPLLAHDTGFSIPRTAIPAPQLQIQLVRNPLFSGGLCCLNPKIKVHKGQWTYLKGTHWQAMPNPLESNARHIQVPNEILYDLDWLPRTMGVRVVPWFINVVVVPKHISRGSAGKRLERVMGIEPT